MARKVSSRLQEAFDPSNVFDLYHRQFKRFVDVEQHYNVATPLWTLHTFVYEQFDYSPRLLMTSPVENCGKSAVLDVLTVLANDPEQLTSATAANVFRMTHLGKTLLLDEFDNVNMTGDLTSVLNDGYKIGKSTRRIIGGESVAFSLYAPVAIATNLKGTSHLPLPSQTMSRSIIIRIKRAYPGVIIPRVNFADTRLMQELHDIKQKAVAWAAEVKLNPNPVIPPGIVNRRDADIWRILLSIADALGRGDLARDAALKIIGDRGENVKVQLLIDIRTIFRTTGYKGMPIHVILEKLLELSDDGDSAFDWNAFQNGKLTKSKISRMLSDFEIHSHSIRWPEGRHHTEQTVQRGLTEEDFHDAWRRYCPQ